MVARHYFGLNCISGAAPKFPVSARCLFIDFLFGAYYTLVALLFHSEIISAFILPSQFLSVV
jgi:hypothetical protein